MKLWFTLITTSLIQSFTASHRSFSCTHVVSSYANLLQKRESLYIRKKLNSHPTGLVCNTNMAAVSLFWDTDMADLTSCENAL